MDEGTWNTIQAVGAIGVLVLMGVYIFRNAMRRTWIHIRGRDRHRVVTAQDLWDDPARIGWEARRHHHPGGGFDGDGGDCGDAGDGGGGDGGGGD